MTGGYSLDVTWAGDYNTNTDYLRTYMKTVYLSNIPFLVPLNESLVFEKNKKIKKITPSFWGNSLLTYYLFCFTFCSTWNVSSNEVDVEH